MNLIRMNLYRFMRTKTVYVLLLITIFIVGLIILDQNSQEAAAINQQILQEEGFDSEEKVGLTMGLEPIESVSMMTTDMVCSGMVLVFTSIFAAIFSNAERAGGYLKNLNSCAGTKEQIFIAKIVPVMLFVLLNLWIIPLMAKLFGLQRFDIFTKDFMLFMAVQWLLHVAYGIFILMLMEITRNLVSGILVGVFSSMGVFVMLIQFVENIFHGNGAISGHMLVQMARMFMLDNVGGLLIPALLTGVISFILYSVVGALVFKKRDIY